MDNSRRSLTTLGSFVPRADQTLSGLHGVFFRMQPRLQGYVTSLLGNMAPKRTADPATIELFFHIFLQRPGRPEHIAAKAGEDFAIALDKFLQSTEFSNRVLPSILTSRTPLIDKSFEEIGLFNSSIVDHLFVDASLSQRLQAGRSWARLFIAAICEPSSKINRINTGGIGKAKRQRLRSNLRKLREAAERIERSLPDALTQLDRPPPTIAALPASSARESALGDSRSKRELDRALWQLKRGETSAGRQLLRNILASSGPAIAPDALFHSLLATGDCEEAAALLAGTDGGRDGARFDLLACVALARKDWSGALHHLRQRRGDERGECALLRDAAASLAGETDSEARAILVDLFAAHLGKKNAATAAHAVTQSLLSVLGETGTTNALSGLHLLKEPGALAIVHALLSALALSQASSIQIASMLRTLARHNVISVNDALVHVEKEYPTQANAIAACFSFSELERTQTILSAGRHLVTTGNTRLAIDFFEEVLRREPANKDAAASAVAIATYVDRHELASDLLAGPLWDNGKIHVHERVARLERHLCTRDSSRSTERLMRSVKHLRDNAVRTLSSHPADIRARRQLAQSMLLAERFDHAADVLASLIADMPTDPELLRDALVANEKLANWDRADAIATLLLTQDRSARNVLAKIKALRQADRCEAAQQILIAHQDIDHPDIRREYIRNLFYVGDFEAALSEGVRLSTAFPDDLHLRYLLAATRLELGHLREGATDAYVIEMDGGEKHFPLDLPFLRYAFLHRLGHSDTALKQINGLFAQLGCQPLARQNKDRPDTAFDAMVGTRRYPYQAQVSHPPVFDGPLVSVVMTTYNSKNFVDTAVRSILEQSYENLELIIVDDASSDGTAEYLLDIERRNSRVKVILKSTNDGTYVSKNIGLLQAQGEYVALQDSDDYSHPDRIAKSISFLIDNPNVVGITTDWIRMTTEGDIVIKSGGQVAHVCCISLVFRRVQILKKIGFFDSVRIEADMEYIRRMSLAFGASAVRRLRWPLLLGRSHSASLTANDEYGITRTGFTEPRRRYQAAYKAVHRSVPEGEGCYIAFPLAHRKWDAPDIMLPAYRKSSPAQPPQSAEMTVGDPVA